MKFLLSIVISAFLAATIASAQIEITEIMYDPSSDMGSDSDLEWIELYNSGTEAVSLSEYSLNGYNLPESYAHALLPSQYLVIAKELVDGLDKDVLSFESFYGNADGVWDEMDVNLSAIFQVINFHSLSLGNKGGTINLNHSSSSLAVFDIAVSYVNSYGGKGNGHSLELVNGQWLDSRELYGTPGRKNTADPSSIPPPGGDIFIDIVLDSPAYTGSLYSNLFKIKLLDKLNCSEKDFVEIFYSILDENNKTLKEDTFLKENIGCSTAAGTGNIIFPEGGTFNLCGRIVSSSVPDLNFLNNAICRRIEVIDIYSVPCDLAVDIITNETIIYDEGQSLKYELSVNDASYPFTVDYWIEDLFGNIVKDKVTTRSMGVKSWKTNIIEEDRVLFVKAVVSPLCNDANINNNYNQKMFIVAESQTNTTFLASSGSTGNSPDSRIKIVKVTPEVSVFGGLVRIEIEVYKGSTNKYSLNAFVEKGEEKVSQTTKINLKEKFTDYKLTLPIQLKPNCNLKIAEGKAEVIIKGLDQSAKKEIVLDGVDKVLCRDYLSYVKEEDKSKNSGKSMEKSTKRKLSYSVTEFPEKISSGEEFDISLFFSGDSSEHEFKIWSYLYRGSRCYSCCADCELVFGKDNNFLEFSLAPDEDREIRLSLSADKNMEAGEYKLKVKINKDNQKTDNELTKAILVIGESSSIIEQKSGLTAAASSDFAGPSSGDSIISSTVMKDSSKGLVVYESSSEKARKIIPQLLALAFGLLSAVLIFTKA